MQTAFSQFKFRKSFLILREEDINSCDECYTWFSLKKNNGLFGFHWKKEQILYMNKYIKKEIKKDEAMIIKRINNLFI